MLKTQFSFVKVYFKIVGELMETFSYDENTHFYNRLELEVKLTGKVWHSNILTFQRVLDIKAP